MGIQNSAALMKGNVTTSNKTAHAFTFDTAILLLGIYTEDGIPKTHLYKINHCSIIYNYKGKCPYLGVWINKLWHVYSIEYYAAKKKKKRMRRSFSYETMK